MMKKFLIATPGRTASTSFFNCIEDSLKKEDANVFAVDRAAYTFEEMDKFNAANSAVCTMFNPYKLPFFIEDINPAEWCLIVLTRKDFSKWLLSMISIHATGEWHPGKDRVVNSFRTTQVDTMSAYWYYKCWTERVELQADTFGFGKVVRIDFDDLTKDWSKAGKLLSDWRWNNDSRLMKLGMTTSWKSVENIKDVLEWLPADDVQLIQDIQSALESNE